VSGAPQVVFQIDCGGRLFRDMLLVSFRLRFANHDFRLNNPRAKLLYNYDGVSLDGEPQLC